MEMPRENLISLLVGAIEDMERVGGGRSAYADGLREVLEAARNGEEIIVRATGN